MRAAQREDNSISCTFESVLVESKAWDGKEEVEIVLELTDVMIMRLI